MLSRENFSAGSLQVELLLLVIICRVFFVELLVVGCHSSSHVRALKAANRSPAALELCRFGFVVVTLLKASSLLSYNKYSL